MKKLWNKESLLQFIKFGMVGCSNTIISLAIYYGIVWLGGNYIFANMVGFFVSVLNAYYWNSKYVFKSEKKRSKVNLVKTYASYGITFIISNVLLYILVDHMGVSKWLAPILCLIVTIPLNFLLNKFWTFKEDKNDK